jgi:hypothetical protein
MATRDANGIREGMVNLRRTEEGVDGAAPVDAQNAPTSRLENRTARGFPHRPHPVLFCARKKKMKRDKDAAESLAFTAL